MSLTKLDSACLRGHAGAARISTPTMRMEAFIKVGRSTVRLKSGVLPLKTTTTTTMKVRNEDIRRVSSVAVRSKAAQPTSTEQQIPIKFKAIHQNALHYAHSHRSLQRPRGSRKLQHQLLYATSPLPFPRSLPLLICLSDTGGDCSGGDETKLIPLDLTCQQAPQPFLSYDPKDLKADCTTYSDSGCKNVVQTSEKGATTCQENQGGVMGVALSCTEMTGI